MSVNDQDLKMKIQKEEEECAKASEAAKKEEAHREAQNRFKEL